MGYRMGKVETEKKIMLSIGILVSNHIEYIRNVLEALKPLLEAVPSELIILDTKGEETDGSIAICREYTDKVYPFIWCKDFSAARNACLSYATGEWFMFQDDDEWFDDVQEIINFFNSGEQEHYNSGFYYVKNYDADGNFSRAIVSRMVRRTEGLCFEGRIHECFNEIREPIKEFQCFVHHMGYVHPTLESRTVKYERNMELLKEELRRVGYTPRVCAQIVQEMMANFSAKSIKEAIDFAEKVLPILKKTGQMQDSCTQWILAATVRSYVVLKDYQGTLKQVKKVQAEYQRSRVAELVISAEVARSANLEKDYLVALEYVDTYLEQWEWLKKHATESRLLMQLDFPSYYAEECWLNMLYIGANSANQEEDFQRAMKYWNRFPWKREYVDTKKYLPELLVTRDGLKKKSGMRRYLKKKVYDWLSVMYRSLCALEKLIRDECFDVAYNLIVKMQKGAIHIGNSIDETGKNLDLVRDLEQFCELVYVLSEGLQQEEALIGLKEIEKLLKTLEEKLENIPSAKLEVVFLPYKLSMWDSMESIWMAAEEDSECNAYVVPIPYYSRKGNYEFDQLFYEGHNYPSEVPVIDYKAIDLESLHPDIIFYHNPYDENNSVTSVVPQYYSSELKKYAGALVYVPYTMYGAYENVQCASLDYSMPGIQNSDYIVLQSERHKALLEALGIEEKKLLPLGSPKIDATLRGRDAQAEIIKKLAGTRKKILLNTTIARFLKSDNWFKSMDDVLRVFEEDDSLFLIWRPHPLLRETVSSMRNEMLLKYDILVSRVEQMKNAMIDRDTETYPAFWASDALITDNSSIMLQYLATGKPILNVEGSASEKETKLVVVDFYSCYYMKDGMSYERFVKLIKEDRDEKKEERLNALRATVNNCDGTCGKKVYMECKKRVTY